ncbi:MAG: tellurium resistance protein TerC [Pseudomonadota bacterium]
MIDLLTFENLANLAVLIFLQAVLGFDNLLYISIESRRAPAADQARVRRLGIALAVILRLVLLFAMLLLLDTLKEPLFGVSWSGVVEGEFTFATVVFLLGGAFIMYTAMKEISHMLAIQHIDADVEKKGTRSAGAVIFWIVLMNLVFSFDSILSAIAITDVFFVLAAAIVSSGVLMIVMADRVSEFLARNRMYEVLGLFILLIVGVLLLSEGGHQAHLKLFGYPVEAMSKTTFYFSVAVMVLLDVVQSRYKRQLLAEKKAEIERHTQSGLAGAP